MSRIQPICPKEVAARKKNIIPDQVIDAFNCLIVKNYNNSCRIAEVPQKEVVSLIMTKMGMKFGDRHKIFDEGWLEVEDIFSLAGWKVTYEKPAYNESGSAKFIFVTRPSPREV